MNALLKKYRHNDHALGIFFIICSAFCFSLMSLFIKRAGSLPTFQKALFRNLVALLVATVLLLRAPGGFKPKKGSGFGLFMRALCGTLGLLCNFYAIDRLGLADANILNKMSPFFAMIVSAFIINEKPNRVEILCVILAFVGAVFVIKPHAGFSASFPAFVGLLGGLGAGTAYAFVRKLGLQGERGPVIVFAFSAFSVLLCLPFVCAHYVPMSGTQLMYLLLGGTAAAGGQLSVTAAYTHAPAMEISVFDYTQVLFATLWGLLFFGEIPDTWSLIGYVFIIGTAVFKWYYNLYLKKG
ncbi:DMT family transporter [Pseudoramibacter sp.]|uniref:DMT family transporter n=1 Tax=Pseudoramibacter sp. TaxID=2034862 RepID=UPI0029E8B731|nr:DMT family transporter [Pseudoramibacter sp.]MCH4105291.1 DMT family transporter [Pseudoramibacter sp.]